MSMSAKNLPAFAKPLSLSIKSDIGILVIHGFTSTVSSMQYFAEKLNKAGYNVECPSLSGHGTIWHNMIKYTYKDWINDVEIALNKLKQRAKKIFVAGLSMGGTLSLYLAQKHPEITGIILINHALFLNDDWRMAFLPIVRFFVKSDTAVAGDTKDPHAFEMAYDKVPLQSAYQLTLLLTLVKENLSKVTQPVLILKSKEDHVIPLKNATYTMDNVSSINKELVWLENSYHVATIDYDRDIIVKKAIDFIKHLTYIDDNKTTLKKATVQASTKSVNKKAVIKKAPKPSAKKPVTKKKTMSVPKKTAKTSTTKKTIKKATTKSTAKKTIKKSSKKK